MTQHHQAIRRAVLGGMTAIAMGATALSAAAQDDLSIAYFASSSQNGYNQAVYEGIQEAAEEIGGIHTEIYDGEFDPSVQYAQIEDVLTSGNFDGYILFPQDSVGIAGAVEQVAETGKPLVSVLFPIGPSFDTLKPQVDGLTATVGALPEKGARLQAEKVVEFCEERDPCRVVIIIGFKVSPFDQVRLKAYNDVLSQHDNIEVVATVEGLYSPDASLTAMQDVMQANPDFDVVLTNADQHLIGVELAIESMGSEIEPLFLSGGGASAHGIEAIREGRWDNTLAQFPRTMGRKALDIVVADIKGEDHPASVDMDEDGPVPPIVDKTVLENHPDFTGEWQQ